MYQITYTRLKNLNCNKNIALLYINISILITRYQSGIYLVINNTLLKQENNIISELFDYRVVELKMSNNNLI